MWIWRPRKEWSGNPATRDPRLGRVCACLFGQARLSRGSGRLTDELPELVHRPWELPVLEQVRSPAALVERDVAAPLGHSEALSSPGGPRLTARVLDAAGDVVRTGEQVVRLSLLA